MGNKIKWKYFCWAIVFFGMLGVYMPIIVRIFQKSEKIFNFQETIFNLVTYSISIIITSIYSIIIDSSDGTEDFINNLMNRIGYIIFSIIYVLVINFIVTLESDTWSVWIPFALSVIGCFISWRLWFLANKVESFGTGALGD